MEKKDEKDGTAAPAPAPAAAPAEGQAAPAPAAAAGDQPAAEGQPPSGPKDLLGLLERLQKLIEVGGFLSFLFSFF